MDVAVSRSQDLAHEALIYSTDEELLSALVPFVREGITLGQPIVVVLPDPKAALLREALEEDARLVSFVDATALYRSPAHAIVEYSRRMTGVCSGSGTELVRVVGEVQFETSGRDHDAWMRYESAINAVAARWPLWFVCLYDTREHPDDVIADAARTHPRVRTASGPGSSDTYAAPEPLNLELLTRHGAGPDLERIARSTAESEADLTGIRRAVASAARAAGLTTAAVDDVTVAVNELLTEALAQGAAKPSVQMARAGAQWLCEVAYKTEAESPFPEDSPALWIAKLVSDHLEVVSGTEGVSVRLVFELTPPNARARILKTAGELFYQDGIRATGINRIISQSRVAKATFYAQFPSKEALVVAWLQQPETRWLDRVFIEVEVRTQSPAERLLTFFDVLGERIALDDFRGCVYLNAAAEIPQRDHPARQVIREYMDEIRAWFRRTAREAGLARPDEHAEQLHDLAAGAIVTAVATGSPHTARAARAAAEQLQILAQKAE